MTALIASAFLLIAAALVFAIGYQVGAMRGYGEGMDDMLEIIEEDDD